LKPGQRRDYVEAATVPGRAGDTAAGDTGGGAAQFGVLYEYRVDQGVVLLHRLLQSYGKLIAQELGQWGQKGPHIEEDEEGSKQDWTLLDDEDNKIMDRLIAKATLPPKTKPN
jgi:hypothetical protein